MIGQTIKNRYRIYDRLGSGGAATVYLGRDAQTGQMVVIKVVHAHLVNEQFMGRFQREIDLLSQIDSPYIVKLYDWALREYDQTLGQTLSYIVAEFIEGHTLAEIIDTRGKFSEPDALATARQIALALAAIHSKGIVHRDIKSQNIMITPGNQVKLIDFGIAKAQNQALLTGSSQFAGTLYYAPPEQILEAHSVDHRADIYALGIVLYEMLMATLPVKAREIGTVASKIIAGDLDPITGVSQPVERLVNDLIAYEPEERIASAAEVVARIEEITGSVRGPSLPEMPPSPATTIAMRAMMLDTPPKPAEPRERFELVTETGVAVEVKTPDTVIGRSHPRDTSMPDVDLWAMGLENARTASRRHCRIFFQDGAYYLEDLGSMNGTWLNDIPLEAGMPHLLNDGDRIAAGRVLLTFRRANV